MCTLVFLNAPATTAIYTLSLHDALPISTIHVGDLYYVDVMGARNAGLRGVLLDEGALRPDADCPRIRTLDDLVAQDRKSTRLNSSHVKISYAVFCLKKKRNTNRRASQAW